MLGGFALRITETGVLGKLGNYESKLKKPQADVKSGCSEHNIGEKMYVRLIGKPSNKRHFTQSCIENRKIKFHTYKVSNTSLLSGKEERKMGLCGRYHKPHIRAIKTETKMPRLSQKKKNWPLRRGDDYATEGKGFRLVYMEMAIANMLHYRTRQRDQAF